MTANVVDALVARYRQPYPQVGVFEPAQVSSNSPTRSTRCLRAMTTEQPPAIAAFGESSRQHFVPPWWQRHR
jgi:hypothetical protein